VSKTIPDAAPLLAELQATVARQETEIANLRQQFGFMSGTLDAMCRAAGFDSQQAVNGNPAQPARHLSVVR
jgi:hypothetical protein